MVEIFFFCFISREEYFVMEILLIYGDVFFIKLAYVIIFIILIVTELARLLSLFFESLSLRQVQGVLDQNSQARSLSIVKLYHPT